MISIRQYLFSILNSEGLTRTLGKIDYCRDPNGNPVYSAGNSAVVFKIRHAGGIYALRCYTRTPRNLAAIYVQSHLPGELFVYHDRASGRWVDVVLTEWIEGESLHNRILTADNAEFTRLAVAFDTLASKMLCDESAHGDLKPENLIVCTDGTIRPIDLDASFLPCFAGAESPELGTVAFQHPSRTPNDFDARLDDFPAALISTALHALSLDPSLRERYDVQDALLIDPRTLPHDPALTEILDLFARHGDARHYRIARLLLQPTLRLPKVGTLLSHTPEQPSHTPELFVQDGLWGFRDSTTGKIACQPLYNSGFDFTEGLAAVQLGSAWHFIDTQGRTVIRCAECEAVKPFRNGQARILLHGVWHEIDRTGKCRVLEY